MAEDEDRTIELVYAFPGLRIVRDGDGDEYRVEIPRGDGWAQGDPGDYDRAFVELCDLLRVLTH